MQVGQRPDPRLKCKAKKSSVGPPPRHRRPVGLIASLFLPRQGELWRANPTRIFSFVPFPAMFRGALTLLIRFPSVAAKAPSVSTFN